MITCRMSKFKVKQKMIGHKKALRDTDTYIYQMFSTDTIEFRTKLWTNILNYEKEKDLNPLLGMGLFGLLMENLSHMSYNDETWHSYTLPKEAPKLY